VFYNSSTRDHAQKAGRRHHFSDNLGICVYKNKIFRFIKLVLFSIFYTPKSKIIDTVHLKSVKNKKTVFYNSSARDHTRNAGRRDHCSVNAGKNALFLFSLYGLAATGSMAKIIYIT